MITDSRAFEIITSRNLQIIPINSPRDNSIEWIARTIDGTRAAPGNIHYPSPQLAVEAAEIWFVAAEERERERSAERILSSLESGKYYIRPQEVSIVDEFGQPGKVIVFSSFLPDGTETGVKGKPSILEAALETDRQIKEREEKARRDASASSGAGSNTGPSTGSNVRGNTP